MTYRDGTGRNDPFLLRPAGKTALWGGTRLNDELARGVEMAPLAETWECSTHPDGLSTVASGAFAGRTLAEVLDACPGYLGSRHADGRFPLLVKFIDAEKDLSVQVHPDDAFAQAHEAGQRGKDEVWYLLDARRDTKMICGLRRDCTGPELRRAVAEGTLPALLRQVPARKNDLFFIRAGTIHAIGAGALVAEIQENSNLTYRLYDYDRTDQNGNRRELQIDKALGAASLKESSPPRRQGRVLQYRPGAVREFLCRCKSFEVFRLQIDTQRRQRVRLRTGGETFEVLLCIGGCGLLRFEGGELLFFRGDCLFLPARSAELTLLGQACFLQIRG